MVSTVPESVTVCVGSVLWSCAQLGTDRAKTNPTALSITFPRFMDLSSLGGPRLVSVVQRRQIGLSDHIAFASGLRLNTGFFADYAEIGKIHGAGRRMLEYVGGWPMGPRQMLPSIVVIGLKERPRAATRHLSSCDIEQKPVA